MGGRKRLRITKKMKKWRKKEQKIQNKMILKNKGKKCEIKKKM